MAEEKKKRSSVLYDRGKDDKPEKKAEPEKSDKKEPEADKPSVTDRKDEGEGVAKNEQFMTDVDALFKSHEGQRRDQHGNHREELRQMHARHMKEMRDLFTKHMAPQDQAPAPAMEGEAEPAE